jgi:hypothetical protein
MFFYGLRRRHGTRWRWITRSNASKRCRPSNVASSNCDFLVGLEMEEIVEIKGVFLGTVKQAGVWLGPGYIMR